MMTTAQKLSMLIWGLVSIAVWLSAAQLVGFVIGITFDRALLALLTLGVSANTAVLASVLGARKGLTR